MHPQLTLDLAHDAQQRRLEEARRHRGPHPTDPSLVMAHPQLPASRLATVLDLGRRFTAWISPARRTA